MTNTYTYSDELRVTLTRRQFGIEIQVSSSDPEEAVVAYNHCTNLLGDDVCEGYIEKPEKKPVSEVRKQIAIKNAIKRRKANV